MPYFSVFVMKELQLGCYGSVSASVSHHKQHQILIILSSNWVYFTCEERMNYIIF